VLHMTKNDYAKVLRILRKKIDTGLSLSCVDSDTIGNKYTECSWGICMETPDNYPDESMRIRPELMAHNRVASKFPPEGFNCPLDKHPEDRWGCFYRCRAFQGGINREQALALYDETLKQLDQ